MSGFLLQQKLLPASAQVASTPVLRGAEGPPDTAGHGSPSCSAKL